MQRRMQVSESEHWVSVSEKIAPSFGMPELARFKSLPVDSDVTLFSPDENNEEGVISVFDWKERMQYWWTNEYDPAKDLRSGEGRQITLRDSEGNEDTAAIYDTWSNSEIAKYIEKLFAVPKREEVVPSEINPNTKLSGTEERKGPLRGKLS
jgi:hypothetical protein